MYLLFVLVPLTLLVAPIVMAIVALARVNRLAQSGPQGRPVGNPDLELRLAALERRVAALSHTAAAASAPPAAAPQPGAPPPAPPAPQPAPPLPPSPSWGQREAQRSIAPPDAGAPQPHASEGGLEGVIAGRWLNRIGILASVIGVAFFIKYAADNEWIGPAGRVAAGMLMGAGLVAFSHVLLRKGLVWFADGIAGLGAAAMYVSLYLGWSHYHLFGSGAAFGAMIAVTAAMTALALGRDSQRIALVALGGGYLAPALASEGRDAQVVLFTYVAVLGSCFLALAWQKRWRFIELPGFIATQIYFWAWYEQFYRAPGPLGRTVFFAALFALLFAAVPYLTARVAGLLHPEQVLLVLAGAASFTIALRELLWEAHRWELTLAVLASAAFYLALERATPTAPENRRGMAVPARLIFAGVALTLATLAIPIRLEGRWITNAWSIEAAVLAWSGLRAGSRWLRAASLVMFGVVIARLFDTHGQADRFLLNERAASFALAAAALYAALWMAARWKERLEPWELPCLGIQAVAANAVTLIGLSLEVTDALLPRDGGPDAWRAPHLGLTLLWAGFASLLLTVGTLKQVPSLRWQALALFGITAVKVFLIDMSFLSGGYRVISSLALGAVLLAVSYFYQRKLAGGRRAG